MLNPNSNDDHERFTRLLLESEPVMLRSILVSVPNRADAREIMQETAVALWRQFPSYDTTRPFVNWAMGFSCSRASMACSDSWARRDSRAIEALEQEMQTMGEMDDAIETHLANCMGKLSERARRLVKGYYHEERSPETLSEREGRSVEAIYKTIQRARRDLRACIERQIRKAQA